MRQRWMVLAMGLMACTGTEPAAGPTTPAPESKPAAAPAAATPDLPPVPEGASVSFGAPAEGATVKSPVEVEMVATGIGVEPAGQAKAGFGHHHIIVDGEGDPVGSIVPKDATHIHYGDGSTATKLELAPGPHTLTLQFADGLHRSYGPALSTTIHITVE